MQYIKNRWILDDKIEKREYQEKIAESASKANTLCVLPTALGKTIISLLVVTKVLDKDMNKRILFLAPTRPLVDQHKNTYEKFLKLGLNLVPITGKIKPEERKKLYRTADIIFSTPQCIKNDLKNNFFNFTDFSLLIVDEVQHCIGNYAYTFVAKKFIEQSNKLILGLTASPGARYSKINQIKKNLFIKNVEIRDEKDEDVKEFVEPINLKWIEINLPEDFEIVRKKLFDFREEKIKKLISWGVIYSPNITKTQIIELQSKLSRTGKSGFTFAALSMLAEILKIDYAIELLETQTTESLNEYIDKIFEHGKSKKTKADTRLANDEIFKEIYVMINKLGVHPKLFALENTVKDELKNQDTRVIIFAQFRSTVKSIKDMLEKIPNCKPVVLVGQSGKDGLKQSKQIELISMYDAGFYNTLITTSIGEEGIHLGSATTAIFYEPIPSEIRSVQRRGRVGREQPGRIFILMTKKTRDEAYYWSAFHKEKKMKNILYRMKDQMDLKGFEG